MYSTPSPSRTGRSARCWTRRSAPEGEDWALVWTDEELVSERVEQERSGWFGTVEREIFALDPFAGRGADTGATRDRARR